MFNESFASQFQFNHAHRHDPSRPIKVRVEDVSFWYGEKQALKHVSLDIFSNEVTAFVGPSGCGKSTLLRCLNRTNDVVADARMEGRILLDGLDVNGADIDPPLTRQRFGWIAQRPDPLPWSIRSNVLYGPSLRGLYNSRSQAEEIVETALKSVGLWPEVKDRLQQVGTDLSVGQQQRLCMARAIASHPEVLLMDEPCSALDPIATALVEDLITEMRASYTIVIITHNLQQAARIADRGAFFHDGEVLEAADIDQFILNPRNDRCRAFITGVYG